MAFRSLNYRTKKPQLHVNNTKGMKGEENNNQNKNASFRIRGHILSSVFFFLWTQQILYVKFLISFFVSVMDVYICTAHTAEKYDSSNEWSLETRVDAMWEPTDLELSSCDRIIGDTCWYQSWTAS